MATRNCLHVFQRPLGEDGIRPEPAWQVVRTPGTSRVCLLRAFLCNIYAASPFHYCQFREEESISPSNGGQNVTPLIGSAGLQVIVPSVGAKQDIWPVFAWWDPGGRLLANIPCLTRGVTGLFRRPPGLAASGGRLAGGGEFHPPSSCSVIRGEWSRRGSAGERREVG